MKYPRIPSNFEVEKLDFSPAQSQLQEIYKKSKNPTDGEVEIKPRYDCGIVHTKKGMFLLDTEGVIDINPLNGKDFNDVYFYATGTHSIDALPFTALRLNEANVGKFLSGEKIPLHEFVRTFGSRLENNYDQCVRHLQENNIWKI